MGRYPHIGMRLLLGAVALLQGKTEWALSFALPMGILVIFMLCTSSHSV